LGDWEDRYDICARRAVEGRWAESGEETVKRRRKGLIPETPVSSIEKPTKKS
jgi:4-hydroxy-3-polyprenylbenzoate decarboxylase